MTYFLRSKKSSTSCSSFYHYWVHDMTPLIIDILSTRRVKPRKKLVKELTTWGKQPFIDKLIIKKIEHKVLKISKTFSSSTLEMKSWNFVYMKAEVELQLIREIVENYECSRSLFHYKRKRKRNRENVFVLWRLSDIHYCLHFISIIFHVFFFAFVNNFSFLSVLVFSASREFLLKLLSLINISIISSQ